MWIFINIGLKIRGAVVLPFSEIVMNYPAASYEVSTVIPAKAGIQNMLDWIPDQVRDDKTKQASGNLTRRD